MEIWPNWQIESLIGEGGFGKVYKARKEVLGEVAYSAIKVIDIPHDMSEVREMASSGLTQTSIVDYYRQDVKRYLDEIRLMEKMKTASHIVSIEDYEVVEKTDKIGWTIYIRMELLKSLADHMQEKKLSVQEVQKMGLDILTALEFCHEQHLIHRDIKPSNIFVTPFGEYKLGDFGISREVERTNATLSQKGTKSYMAPEMILGEKYGKDVDLYALGLTMYELLNHGRMPFLPAYPEPYYPQDREEAIYKRRKGEVFPEIEGIGELNAIIQKACAFHPSDRYASAQAMKEALEAYQAPTVNEMIMTEEKTETLFSEEDESTMNVFTNAFQNNPIKTEMPTKDKPVMPPVSEIVTAVVRSFYTKQGIQLEGDALALERLQAEVKRLLDAGASWPLVIDIPYITITEQGPCHLHVSLSMQDMQTEQSVPTLEPLQHFCPYCGKGAGLVFTHGYYCQSCGKVYLTVENDRTQQLRQLYLQFQELQDNNEKRVLLEKMHTLDPESAQLLTRMGMEYRQSNQGEMALQCYREAQKRDDRDAVLDHNLGIVQLILLDQPAEAINSFQSALKKDKLGQSSSLTLRPLILGNLAIALEKVGKSRQALVSLCHAYHEGYPNVAAIYEQYHAGNVAMDELLDKYLVKLATDIDPCNVQSDPQYTHLFPLSNGDSPIMYAMPCRSPFWRKKTEKSMRKSGIAVGMLFSHRALHFYHDAPQSNGYFSISYIYFPKWTFTVENNQIILQNGNLKFHVNMTGPELPKYVLSCLQAIQKEIQACTNVPLDVYI